MLFRKAIPLLVGVILLTACAQDEEVESIPEGPPTHQMMTDVDTNNDQKISKDELHQRIKLHSAFSAMEHNEENYEIPEIDADLKAELGTGDTDGDGMLSEKEMIAALKLASGPEDAEEGDAEDDSNQMFAIRSDAFMKAQIQTDTLRFAAADTDKDGLLGLEEVGATPSMPSPIPWPARVDARCACRCLRGSEARSATQSLDA